MQRFLPTEQTIEDKLSSMMNIRLHRFAYNHLYNPLSVEVQQETDFKGILAKIADNVKYLHAKRQPVEIHLNVRHEAAFLSYPERMEMILYKIIANSVKNVHTAIEKPFVYVRVYSHVAGASISVRDNCRAVNKSAIENTFGIFRKQRQVLEDFALELYVVKETIEKLNGYFNVEIDEADGTEFNIHIPNLCN